MAKMRRKASFVQEPVQIDNEEESTAVDPLEYRVPLIMFAVGLAALVLAAFVGEGAKDGMATLVGSFIGLAVQIPIVIAGLYIVAAVFGISYGELKSGIVKLAGIVMLQNGVSLAAIAFTGPWIALPVLLIMFAASWYFFSLLFDLDATETALSAVGLQGLAMAAGSVLSVVGGS